MNGTSDRYAKTTRDVTELKSSHERWQQKKKTAGGGGVGTRHGADD